MMAIEKKLYTVEEFERFAERGENRDRLLELIQGEIFEKMPTEEHGVVAANIVAALSNFVKPRKLGRIGVEVRHRMPNDKANSRLPDVSFRSETQTPIVTKGSVPMMPDLAVEIHSPDDAYQDLDAKARYYLKNGSRLVWIVYPKTRIVKICTLTETGDLHEETVGIEAKLSGKDVLPGFTLPVSEIFDF
jgi:Uma2 family endonuclease